MLEPWLYRTSLLLGVFAAVVMLFSLVARPAPIQTDLVTESFDADRARAIADRFLEAAPERRPGSDGDQTAADLVAKRFKALEGGTVAVQEFDGHFDGRDVKMHNVMVTLPGDSNEQVVVTAPRDCASGPCAATSAAATGALVELATTFASTRNRKTLVFVSTDGSAAGAAGTRALADQLAQAPPHGIVVISQPGVDQPTRPFVVPWSTGANSGSIQLLESAQSATRTEFGSEPGPDVSTLGGLLRLALPAGLGEQGPLVDSGLDAMAISSAGARPISPGLDTPESLSTETLAKVGGSTLSMVVALDGSDRRIDHGPDAYISLGGKLIPGWAIALLAIALLIPVGAVSIDILVRAARRHDAVLSEAGWLATRLAPFAALLLLLLLMALVKLVPSPTFPYDPARLPLDAGAAISMLALVAVFLAVFAAVSTWTRPSGTPEGLSAVIGTTLFAAVLIAWFANPFLALVLVPTAHLWLCAALPRMRGRPLPAIAALAAGALFPIGLILHAGSELGRPLAAPWDLLIMVTGNHLGLGYVFPAALLGACLVAILQLALGGPIRSRPVRPRPGDAGRDEAALINRFSEGLRRS